MSQLTFLPNGKQVPPEMSSFYEMEVSVWKGVLFMCTTLYPLQNVRKEYYKNKTCVTIAC